MPEPLPKPWDGAEVRPVLAAVVCLFVLKLLGNFSAQTDWMTSDGDLCLNEAFTLFGFTQVSSPLKGS